MKQMIRAWLLAASFVFVAGGSFMTVATPQTVDAACTDRVLGFPTWYRGVEAGECSGLSPVGNIKGYVTQIALNIVEIILVAVGYVCVGFIIYGGFKYMTGAGSPDQISGAKSTITNAIIGLIISFFAVAIVNIVAGGIN